MVGPEQKAEKEQRARQEGTGRDCGGDLPEKEAALERGAT